MCRAAKVHANLCPLLALVYFYNAAFNAFKRPFNNHNAVVFVKAHQRLANLRPQPQKMLNNLQIMPAQSHNISIAVQKVIKIRHLLKRRQGKGIHLSRRLHNNVRRKHRLQLLHNLPLPPYSKLAREVNKIMLLNQLRSKLLHVLNKKLLPPRGHLNNVVLHQADYNRKAGECHCNLGSPPAATSCPPGSALPQFGTRSILGGEIRRLRLPRKVVETTLLAATAPTAFSIKYTEKKLKT